MKKLILIFCLLFMCASTRATTITVSSYTPQAQWNYGSPATVRIYTNSTFVDSDGVLHIAQATGGPNFYQVLTCTVTGTAITVPSFTIASTTNSPTNPNATFSFIFYDKNGVRRDTFASPIKVPTILGTTITWGSLLVYNSTHPNPPGPQYPDIQQVQALINQVLPVADASDVIKGKTKLSVAATVSTNPVAVGDNDPRVVSDTTYASLSAAVTAIGSMPTTLNITTAAFPNGGNVSVPATLELRPVGAGTITITTGQTVTVLSSPSRWPTRKLFLNALSGQGSVSFAGNNTLIEMNPIWWGAAYDDTTDAAPAINAAIASLGSTSTTRGGPRIVISGPAAIASTILINRKSLTFAGLGWGRQGSTGQQSYLRWIGSAGSPMLRLQNVQGVIVENLRLIGNSSAKPSCAISLFQEAGFGINANVIRNVAIGNITDGTAITTGFTIGIAWEGLAANNSEWQFYNVSIDGCATAGIRQNSVQNVDCVAHGLQITNSVIGIYITGEFVGTNWNFGANTNADIVFPAQDDNPQNIIGQLSVTGFHSEGSARMAILTGEAQLYINTGNFQYGSFTAADGKYIKHETQGNSTIRLTDFGTSQVSVPTVTPFISLLRTSYFNQSLDVLVLDGVSIPAGGPESNGVSAATKGYLDQKFIYYRDISGTSTDADGAPVTATTNYLGGVFGTGPGFALNRQDFPNKIRYIPTTEPTVSNNITAAGNSIVANRRTVLITNTTGGSITLTSTPTIADGSNGEVIRVVNVGTQNVVIQDQGTLANSNLRLTGNSITLGPRDSIELTFFATIGGVTLGDWVQTGNVVNVL